MLNYIKGKIVEICDNLVVVENNGIAYEVFVSTATLVGLKEEQQVCLYTYLQVKEDAFCLFGFSTKDEKKMFLRLTSVAGVGPKVALSVLSGVKINELAMAILNNDAMALTRIKGLGKKTAERIILELKGKILPTEALGVEEKLTPKTQLSKEGEEAIMVLVSLGLTNADATARTRKCIENGYTTAEEILAHALKG